MAGIFNMLPWKSVETVSPSQVAVQESEVPKSSAEKRTASSRKTLPELFFEALPDAKIEIANVLILGTQSSGKTCLIISLLFSYLLDHPHFTNEMGQKMLKLLRTGRSQVTCHPITVSFISSSSDECKIRLKYQDHDGWIETDLFDQILDELVQSYDERQLSMSEVVVEIYASNVPNITFTDLPGLTTVDKRLSDDPQGRTLKEYIFERMQQKNTALVIVEKASEEEYETSHICPLLAKCVNEKRRIDIFDHTVLVLTKCDQSSPSALRKQVLTRVFESGNTRAANTTFPFQNVVAVVNKFDNTTNQEYHDLPYNEFTSVYKQTREQEAALFAPLFNNDILASERYYGAKAVFHAMDKVFQVGLVEALKRGEDSLNTKISQHENQLRTTSAPSPNCYGAHQSAVPSSSSSLIISMQHKIDVIEIYRDYARMICCKMEKTFLKIKDSIRHIIKYPENLQSKWNSSGVKYSKLETIDYELYYSRRKIFVDEIKPFALSYVHEVVLLFTTEIEASLTDTETSPFHRIDRFIHILSSIRSYQKECGGRWKEKLSEVILKYLEMIWLFEEPRGDLKDVNRIERLINDEIPHVILTNAFYEVLEVWKKEEDGLVGVTIDWDCPSLLEESASFFDRRKELEDRYIRLRQQKDLLSRILLEPFNVKEILSEENKVTHTSSDQSYEEVDAHFWISSFWYDEYLQMKMKPFLQDEMDSGGDIRLIKEMESEERVEIKKSPKRKHSCVTFETNNSINEDHESASMIVIQNKLKVENEEQSDDIVEEGPFSATPPISPKKARRDNTSGSITITNTTPTNSFHVSLKEEVDRYKVTSEGIQPQDKEKKDKVEKPGMDDEMAVFDVEMHNNIKDEDYPSYQGDYSEYHEYFTAPEPDYYDFTNND